MVKFWILWSALLCGTGWMLSALGQLNRVGYLCVFGLAVAGFWFGRAARRVTGNSTNDGPFPWLSRLRSLRTRFRRPAPFIFLVTALLTLAGGGFSAPLNADTLAYRLPRVLHWLAEGRWHWIRTADPRMNFAGCGFEWLSAPLVLFTGSDRLMFLINWVSYLLLPGLVFSVFTRLGARARVAWWWMWILSSGWCYVLQAGAVLTDSFIIIYALAAVDFALRARQSRRVNDVWFSLLAVALLTGTKQTGVPLALLWLIAFWPAKGLLATRPLSSAAVVGFSLVISAMPIAFFNWQQYGTWVGKTAGYELHAPLWAFIGNAFCLSAQNLLPGFFPWAEAWNEWLRQFTHTALGSHFGSFESFGRIGRAVNEASSGIGLGVVLLALVSWWGARKIRACATLAGGPGVRPQPLAAASQPAMPAGPADAATTFPGATPGDARENASTRTQRWLRRTPWVLLLLFMAKVGTYQNARQLAPYYVFLFPSLLLMAGQAQLVQRRWWQRFGLAVMLSAVALLLVSRDRPLLPCEAISRRLHARHPQSRFLALVHEAYKIRSSSEILRRPFSGELPTDEGVVGYATFHGTCEPGLWSPFGTRRVTRVLQEDSPADIRSRGIRYVVLDEDDGWFKTKPLAQWLTEFNAELVREIAYLPAPRSLPNRLYLVRLKPDLRTSQTAGRTNQLGERGGDSN